MSEIIIAAPRNKQAAVNELLAASNPQTLGDLVSALKQVASILGTKIGAHVKQGGKKYHMNFLPA